MGLENSEAEGRKNMAPWMRMWTDEIGGWGGDGSRHVSPWQSVTRGDQTDPGAVGSHRSLKVNSFNGSDSPPFPFSSSCLAPVNNIYIYICMAESCSSKYYYYYYFTISLNCQLQFINTILYIYINSCANIGVIDLSYKYQSRRLKLINQ